MGEERGGWGEDEIEDSLCDYVVDSNDETEVIVMPDEDEPSVQAAREDSSEPERWPPFVDVAKVGSSILITATCQKTTSKHLLKFSGSDRRMGPSLLRWVMFHLSLLFLPMIRMMRKLSRRAPTWPLTAFLFLMKVTKPGSPPLNGWGLITRMVIRG
jgi:hypothetical protein